MPTNTEPEQVRENSTSEPENLVDLSAAQPEEVRDSVDAAGGQPGDASCGTQPLVPAFSICLARKRSCPYAMSFGHQYLCRHPDHAKFLVPSPKHKK
ncbi:hypothetical protein KP004_01460 [Geomonas oryzisoli]|uniref:Uncharacterized protein n=1 Tax=Geomonas oryzisoli TaxID=2847992 RepID=A0ABX8J6E8_9BACT|nr:hypothetical protein [Geomonas oryzisoli]QWV93890.1 hypothetical protein KP004_01460 [Geomonas oryzisoli]